MAAKHGGTSLIIVREPAVTDAEIRECSIVLPKQFEGCGNWWTVNIEAFSTHLQFQHIANAGLFRGRAAS